MTYVPREQRYRQQPRRPSRAGGRERQPQDHQRRRRRRFRWVRRWRRSTNDTSSSSDEEGDGNRDADSDDMQQDVSPRQRDRPAIAKHPLAGRIGTIATVAYTHEMAALDNPSLETSIDSSQQIFRDHGNDNELVVTAIGTNRFRVVSYVQEDSFADLNVFQVEEIVDQTLCLPRFGRPSASFPLSQPPRQDSNVESEPTKEDGESVESSNPRVARHDQLLWNLSMMTPVPYCAYKATWPWKMVDSIVAVLETHEGRDNLPSLRDVFVSGKSNNLSDESTSKELSSQALEPTKFSYTMSYNMPFSDEEKLELLQMDSTVERLRVVYDKVMEYAERECYVFCKGCDTKLAGVTSVFTVGGAEGATSNYGTF